CRPASLFGLYVALGGVVDREGGEVLSATQTSTSTRRGRHVRWIERVAVVTHGGGVLRSHDVPAGEGMLPGLPRPAPRVADRAFACVAAGLGLEVVAFAGLDALVFAVASWLGRSVRVVPLDDGQAPSAYAPLLDTLATPGRTGIPGRPGGGSPGT